MTGLSAQSLFKRIYFFQKTTHSHSKMNFDDVAPDEYGPADAMEAELWCYEDIFDITHPEVFVAAKARYQSTLIPLEKSNSQFSTATTVEKDDASSCSSGFTPRTDPFMGMPDFLFTSKSDEERDNQKRKKDPVTPKRIRLSSPMENEPYFIISLGPFEDARSGVH